MRIEKRTDVTLALRQRFHSIRWAIVALGYRDFGEAPARVVAALERLS